MEKKQKNKQIRIGLDTVTHAQLLQIAQKIPIKSLAALNAFAVYELFRKTFPPNSPGSKPIPPDPLLEKRMICEKLGGTIEDGVCRWFVYTQNGKREQKVGLASMHESYITNQFGLPGVIREGVIRHNPELAHMRGELPENRNKKPDGQA